MEVDEVEDEDGNQTFDAERQSVEESRKLFESGGVELLALGQFANSLVERGTSIKPPSPPLSTATYQSHEALLILLVEQFLVNPTSRTLFEKARQEKIPRLRRFSFPFFLQRCAII
jgi:hypothetical protein